MNAAAHNAATVGMDFIERLAIPLASAIERLVISSDADAAALCRLLQTEAEQFHNQLDCMREDAGKEVQP